jgi:hypothetical protein
MDDNPIFVWLQLIQDADYNFEEIDTESVLDAAGFCDEYVAPQEDG